MNSRIVAVNERKNSILSIAVSDAYGEDAILSNLTYKASSGREPVPFAFNECSGALLF